MSPHCFLCSVGLYPIHFLKAGLKFDAPVKPTKRAML